MKRHVARALALAAACILTSQAAMAAEKPATVIELFTSQGCNSCPKADMLFGELADRDDIVALAYHVDYWDYLGWKDTLARPENVIRQESYRKALRASSKYTPQLIVNGTQHTIGSDRRAVEALISNTPPAGDRVAVSMKVEGQNIIITAGDAAGPEREANLVLAYLGKPETVAVGRGENRGRTLTYHNPVRDFTTLGMWHGEAMRIEIPLSEFAMHDAGGCAVLLQKVSYGEPGAVLGAAKWSFKKAGL
ncbi:MAG: DUF1223 domain-containing protein [Notoacmeibacter sp.]|nr:DUF1223 domain-containing protein [Notoacmeibacter sp.]MCC0033314.1 DUF1223 domain-containing protein [Brucellaceae bacterium]